MAVALHAEDDASSSLSTSPPLALAADVQHLLHDFLTEKTERERQLQAFADQQALVAQGSEADEARPAAISPEDFVKLFSEDWQLSRECPAVAKHRTQLSDADRILSVPSRYTPAFSERLAKALVDETRPSSTIAFFCCPTGYVATRWHLCQTDAESLLHLRLLECDSRFAAFAGPDFIKYDLENPLDLPESVKNSVDIAIIDPPFLNRATNDKLATSLQEVLRPDGKLILITSPAIEGLDEVYNRPPLGPLRFSPLDVKHAGLRNDFAVMCSWSGGERFGES